MESGSHTEGHVWTVTKTSLYIEPTLLRTHLVGDIVCAGVLHLHHHVGVQEVGLDHVRNERCVFLLEHDGDDVIAYVSFPLQLWITNEQQTDFPSTDLHEDSFLH